MYVYSLTQDGTSSREARNLFRGKCVLANYKPTEVTLMMGILRSLTVVRIFSVASLLLLGVFGSGTSAQTFRGTILGTVTDTSGLAVSGATVTVRNIDTGLVRTVTSGDGGEFSTPELPIGTYSVSVEKSGFKIGLVNGISVEVSSERRADVVLQPGDVSQTVEVSGDTLPQVESTSNTLGGIIESTVVTNLPVNGRDYQKLIFLVPGVAGSPDQITDSPGSYGVFSVNGARGRSNNFLLDGTDMNDGYRNDPAINEAGVFGTPATILPVEAIAELRVLSNFEAEYGRSAGGVINIVTKSGTNDFHGTGFEFLRNTALDARNYFNEVARRKSLFTTISSVARLADPFAKIRLSSSLITKPCVKRARKPASPACPPPRILYRDSRKRHPGESGHRQPAGQEPLAGPQSGRLLHHRRFGRPGSRRFQQHFAFHAVFQSRGQCHRKDRSQFQYQQSSHRPLLHR